MPTPIQCFKMCGEEYTGRESGTCACQKAKAWIEGRRWLWWGSRQLSLTVHVAEMRLAIRKAPLQSPGGYWRQDSMFNRVFRAVGLTFQEFQKAWGLKRAQRDFCKCKTSKRSHFCVRSGFMFCLIYFPVLIMVDCVIMWPTCGGQVMGSWDGFRQVFRQYLVHIECCWHSLGSVLPISPKYAVCRCHCKCTPMNCLLISNANTHTETHTLYSEKRKSSRLLFPSSLSLHFSVRPVQTLGALSTQS